MDVSFANTYASGREAKLLTQDKLLRMLDSGSADDAFRIARESGWGQGESVFSRAADAEERDYVQFVAEFCPDERLKAYLLLGYDYRNAEACYKAARLGLDASKMLAAEGVMTVEELESVMAGGDTDGVAPELLHAITGCDELMAVGKADGQSVGALFQQAYYAHLTRIVPRILRKGLAYRIDTLNLATAIRSGSAQVTDKLFLTGGSLSREEIGEVATAPESLATRYLFTEYEDYAAALHAAWAEREPLYQAERIAESHEYDGIAEDLFSQDGWMPFYTYCKQKLAEIRNVRIIVTALAAGVSRADVTARLRTCL